MSEENSEIENITKKSKKKKKKKSFVKRFFLALLLIIIFLFAGFYIYASSILKEGRNTQGGGSKIDTGLKESNIITDLFSPAQKRVNFVILGVDEDATRTDLMMIGTFKTKEKIIEILSVPRDTKLVFTKEQKRILRENERYFPEGHLKLNEVHHYAGPEMGVDFIVNELEDTFGISIDYYAKINTEGFRYVVDEIGGIKFDVPQRMFYDDWTQDLYIDLYPGEQILNGRQAEGLIRYRKGNYGYRDESPSYIMGDLQRLEVQQAFLKEFIIQVLSKDSIINNTSAIINTLDKYVTTNFNINEVPKYLKYIKDIKAENIRMSTIPNIPYEDGYVEIDEEATEEIIEKIFYDDNNVKTIRSKGKEILILNGGYTVGLAKNKQDILVKNGFTVSEIGDYEDEKQNSTYIYVNKEGLGKDLAEFFNNPKIKVDKDLKDFDIVIVLGIDEK